MRVSPLLIHHNQPFGKFVFCPFGRMVLNHNFKELIQSMEFKHLRVCCKEPVKASVAKECIHFTGELFA